MRFFRGVTTAAAIAALVAAYSFLPLTAPSRSASPDENANRYFAELFADTGDLWRFESINLKAQGMVHPRSMRVVDDFIVPGGFLGLPVLYGAIAAALGKAVLPYLTPIVAVAGVAAWGMLISRLFGRRIGVAAAALLALHPIWWYETARTLQPNVLFLSLVLISAWLFFAEPIHARLGDRPRLFLLKRADAALAGICMGFALAVRTSEAYWLAGGAILLALCAFRRIPWQRACIAAAFAALVCAPFVFLNATVYGSPFATGYGSAGDTPVVDLPHGGGAALIGPLQPFLFPLGFAPRAAFGHFVDFGVQMISWWSLLVGCGLVALIAEAVRLRRRGEKIPPVAMTVAVLAAAISLWLILFYGSWTVRDNPDPNAVTIGSSYLRYWLPIIVFSTLPVAWLFDRAASIVGTWFGRTRLGRAPLSRTSVSSPRGVAPDELRVAEPGSSSPMVIRRGILAICFAFYAVTAATEVMLAPQEGLLATRASLFESDDKAKQIIAATPEDAVIVVDRADKYLFPTRKVIVPLRSDATYAVLGTLSDSVPLYYFGITFPENDIAWLRDTKLPPLGVTIDPVLEIGEETLYRFSPRKP